MTRIQNVKVGDPMGFKVNITAETDLDKLIELLKCYHGGAYVIGKDTSFIETPHYHIHWFSVKIVTANALKVFRSTLKQKCDWLSRADKLYTGQDCESADPKRWIAYCIKEEYVKSSSIEITDEIKILSKSAFENKRQNKVYSEQKKNEEKEKKEFKAKMLKFVKENLDSYNIPDIYKNAFHDGYKIHLLVTKFLKENDKVNSLKKHIIDSYVMYCNIHINGWDEYKILANLYLIKN